MAAKPRKNAAKKAAKKTTKRTTKKTAKRVVKRAAKAAPKRKYTRRNKADAVVTEIDTQAEVSQMDAVTTDAPASEAQEVADADMPADIRQVEVLDIRGLNCIERTIVANWLSKQGYLTPKLTDPANARAVIDLINAPEETVFVFNHQNKIADLAPWEDKKVSRAISKVYLAMDVTVALGQPGAFYEETLSPAPGVVYVRVK